MVIFLIYSLRADYKTAAMWERSAGKRYPTQSSDFAKRRTFKNRGSISSRGKYFLFSTVWMRSGNTRLDTVGGGGESDRSVKLVIHLHCRD